MNYRLLEGDCLDHLKALDDNSVDSIVTDPPYGIGFMGKKWDIGVPAVDVFEQCLRVLKPGGHLLAFGGARTYHRMAVAVEDAGFEIRDQVMWLYGSGFPKSQNVSKAIDKAARAEREVIGPRVRLGDKKAYSEDRSGTEVYGEYSGESFTTAPATDAAKQWDGWGTALKPAHEPIVVARKPLIGTVAANVQAHGPGALNIDGCRVDTDEDLNGGAYRGDRKPPTPSSYGLGGTGKVYEAPQGRWPANVIHDGSDDVLAAFPETQSGKGNVRKASGSDREGNTGSAYGAESRPAGSEMISYGDKGSAARFFYAAKASKKDRDEGMDASPDRILAASNQAQAELKRGNLHQGKSGTNSAKVRKNNHPTVKPTSLMAYLCRLVTPPGGIVLDPFAGSGSTGKAAMLEGFEFIGIEKEPEYVAIAHARIAAVGGVNQATDDLDDFDLDLDFEDFDLDIAL